MRRALGGSGGKVRFFGLHFFQGRRERPFASAAVAACAYRRYVFALVEEIRGGISERLSLLQGDIDVIGSTVSHSP